ncbi:MAG TPA: hypothetical protein VFW93_12945 [Aquabacterium sp.]|uniref:hypothetical protein n=1 Tax=Aquabacterium sp. TaxID=1872578 RepID=UPI002E33ACE1|nr:hypothetical protein [Aquabacterium sp.]HEX5357120.1 hypothetical protein [Aquabacterium sp.]
MTFNSTTRHPLTFKGKALALAVTLLASAACHVTAFAQTSYKWTQTARWKEDARLEASGVVVYPREAYPGKSFDVRPAQHTRKMFPGAIVGDGNNKATSNNLWSALLASRHVVGNSTTLTRARDISEDWDINFIDPQYPTRNYWFDFYVDNYAEGVYVGFAQTIQNGPQKGAAVLGNNNLLAMGDDRGAWLDADGSLSYYWRENGLLDYDSTRTTFNGGPWAGASLRSQLRFMIGYEEGRLYFLEGDHLLHVFDRDLKHLRTDEIYLDGELIDASLGDVVDGKVSGVRYLGWDLGPVIAFVPAPSN